MKKIINYLFIFVRNNVFWRGDLGDCCWCFVSYDYEV